MRIEMKRIQLYIIPIMAFTISAPIIRHAATTSIIAPPIVALTPGLNLFSPTALLTSLLFSPVPITTTVTKSILPGSFPSTVTPNYVSYTALKKPNYSTVATNPRRV